jgi:hypothetical protein
MNIWHDFPVRPAMGCTGSSIGNVHSKTMEEFLMGGTVRTVPLLLLVLMLSRGLAMARLHVLLRRAGEMVDHMGGIG